MATVVMDAVVMDAVVMDAVVMDTVVMDTVVTDTVVMDTVVMDTVVMDTVVWLQPSVLLLSKLKRLFVFLHAAIYNILLTTIMLNSFCAHFKIFSIELDSLCSSSNQILKEMTHVEGMPEDQQFF